MATQTGSIDLAATGSVHLYAEGEYATKDELASDYYSRSDFTLTPAQIASKVNTLETDVGGLGTRMTAAESSITQNATAITAKVSQTDYTGETIASLINQSADTVTIQAQHVEIDGQVTFGAIQSYADAEYDPLGAAGEAAAAATGLYVTEIDGGGITVHPQVGDAENPDDFVQVDGDGIGLYRGGVSVASFGVAEQGEGSTETSYESRVGPEGGAHVTVTDTALEVVNGEGETVASIGESVRFSASTPQYIGGEDAYVAWVDTDDDGVADSLVIAGANVRIGTDQPLSELLDSLSAASAALQGSVADAASAASAAQATADAAQNDAADAMQGVSTANGAIARADEAIEGLQEDLGSLSDSVNAYFDFGTVGLTISKSDSPFSLLLTEDRISFQQGAVTYALTADTAVDGSKTYYTRSGEEGSYVYTAVASPTAEGLSAYYERTVDRSDTQELAYASGDAFVAPTMEVTDELRMGDWAWIPRVNGNLALKWIGD